MTDYDLVVLGAGATGLGAAREGRRSGRRVALVEAERPGGGDRQGRLGAGTQQDQEPETS